MVNTFYIHLFTKTLNSKITHTYKWHEYTPIKSRGLLTDLEVLFIKFTHTVLSKLLNIKDLHIPLDVKETHEGSYPTAGRYPTEIATSDSCCTKFNQYFGPSIFRFHTE